MRRIAASRKVVGRSRSTPSFLIALGRLQMSLRGGSACRGGNGLRGEEGATLVEFALSSSMLLLMLFGIIVISLALYSYNFTAEAARDATRYAIVRGADCTGFADCNITGTQIQTYVQNLSLPGINPTNLQVNTEWYTVTLTNTSNTPTLTDCGSDPLTVDPTSGKQCDTPGNEVQVRVTYTYPLSIPFWGKQSLTMVNQSELVIAQ
jgi:Flp pilus assembly protein TadG